MPTGNFGNGPDPRLDTTSNHFDPGYLYHMLRNAGVPGHEADKVVRNAIDQNRNHMNQQMAVSPQMMSNMMYNVAVNATGQTVKSVSSGNDPSDFDVGDRVELIDNGTHSRKGDKGTVLAIDGSWDSERVIIQFDTQPAGLSIKTFEDDDDNEVKGNDVEASRLIKIKDPKPPKKADYKILDALVIAEDIKNEIVAVLKQQQNKTKLMDEWGLGKVIEYGRGTTFMFWGTPGTGKTYAANLIAKALGAELLVIGAAEIQTSEPGGANRNIQNAFKEAKEKGKVLLLDECDSLIFNRAHLGMVLGGEVNTLLTEIEKSESVVILATNRISDMDAALERRLSLIVEFLPPNLEQRKSIWKNHLPEKMPLETDVIVDDLAQVELTGGLIKNVVLHAARLAIAEESKKVSKGHFDRAITRVKKSQGLMGKHRIQTEGPETGVSVDKKMKERFIGGLSGYKEA